ncbi:NAD(+) synthase [Candidatus Binatus sp.]|uniref:NAD(+) synthase n=1 Tax=Candidatus Binatus sp. TaxID=2811406 RepID=UPI003CBD8DFF
MTRNGSFFNLYNHDFVRIAVGVPSVRVADPAYNADQTIALIRDAAERKAVLALFPELGITAYSCDDLFQQRALLDACLGAIAAVVEATSKLSIVSVIGAPLQIDNHLFNCAIVIHRGKILGVVPKTNLPNYREFYEPRQFTSADAATRDEIDLAGSRAVPFGNNLIFQHDDQPLLAFHAEICEDLWVPIPPSSYAALAGATVLLNLSASNITIGKADYRRSLVTSQSARCLAAYAYSAAGSGESTTDLAWDGHALIAENGNILAESERFKDQPQLIYAELDLERLSQERMRQNTFGDNAQREHERIRRFRRIAFSSELPRRGKMPLQRRYERFPYVPSDPSTRDERCAEVFDIQVQGLTTRLRSTGLERVVIGVSGGIDSTHALLVCARAMDRLGSPRKKILAVTMPGFATSARTLEQARRLMKSLGCSTDEIDIRPSCMQMLKDIGHPYAEGKEVYDVTFENVQAGERTSHLFRLANLRGGLVVGTGDLSELALGWCTYGVGDHMSHYNVNASVPKTLIQHVIRWVAQTENLGRDTSKTLLEILATPISPELIPGTSADGHSSHDTEATIGPYELHDFFLYYTLRFGYPPPKVAFLAYNAWRDKNTGDWPDIPADRRNQYDIATIKGHLHTFLYRFFQLSQFKRSTIPNAPKVGSGGSLSPRGDWRAPSDSEATAWLEQLKSIPDKD